MFSWKAGLPWLVLVSYILLLSTQVFSNVDETCQALAEDGFWQKKEDHKVWQPSTCTIGTYKTQHIDSCLSGRKLTFIGDSTVRQVFYGVAEKLDPSFKRSKDKHIEKQTVKSPISNLTIDFHWDAVLFHPIVRSTLKEWREGLSNTSGALVVGGGLHFAAFVNEPIPSFEKRIDELFPPESAPFNSTQPHNPVHLYLNPILPTEQTHLASEKGKHKHRLIPSIEEPMNDYLRQRFPSNNPSYSVLWAYNEQTVKRPDISTKDGIHSLEDVAVIKADMLLNHYCNAHLAATNEAPHGATCCRKDKNISTGQYISVITFLAAILLAQAFGTSSSISQAVTIFCSVTLLAFFCDRTTYLGKLAKLHNQSEFIVLSLCVTALPMMFTRVRSFQKQLSLPTAQAKKTDELPLSRNQTDEWKGWMQALILIYHWTGSSQIMWVYRIMRLLVAAYVFMAGYGNTLYYLRQEDYSVRRLAQQLLRLNILSVALSYITGLSYLSYYFSPLVSFWVIILYITMGSFHRHNTSLVFLLFKIATACIITTTLVKTVGVLEFIFSLLENVFHIQWNAEQARFRIALDMYIVFFGMLTAIYVDLTQNNDEKLVEHNRRWKKSDALKTGVLFFSAAVLSCWTIFCLPLSTNQKYNALHPYISPAVIIAFVCLRNANARLRTSYSNVMARLGRCSLETFVLQFHIYLADDTKATLSLGLERYFGNSIWIRFSSFIIIALVFLISSESAAKATGVIVNHLTTKKVEESAKVEETTAFYREPISPLTWHQNVEDQTPLLTSHQDPSRSEKQALEGRRSSVVSNLDQKRFSISTINTERRRSGSNSTITDSEKDDLEDVSIESVEMPKEQHSFKGRVRTIFCWNFWFALLVLLNWIGYP